VSDDFGKGITIPVLKDKLGDVSSVDNYRPITVSPVISKIFEYCLLFSLKMLSSLVIYSLVSRITRVALKL